MRLFSLIFVPLFLGAGWVQADPIDELVQAEMKRTNTPGISLAVVRDGRVVREQGYGLANVEHGVPVTAATVFQSGSIGKQLTAALVMLLVEEGKLKLDDPISRHLPKSPKAWKNITVRHLLTHTSGVGDPGKKVDLRKDYTDAQMIAIAASMPLRFQPGERWEYSNTGYHLLGYICNRVGGKFYGDQLRERIFGPLGMGARVISERDIVPHRAAGYEVENGELKNQAWVSPTMNTTADGSLYLTAHDLALWDLALYQDAPLNARVKESSWTPVTLKGGATHPYGFGWDLAPLNGHRRIAHNGSWQGFRSVISRFVDDRLSVIVLANSSSAPVEKIGNAVARHYLPALVQQPIPDTEPEATARARDILAHFERGVQPPRLSPRARGVLTPEFMGWVAKDMQGFGKLVGLEPLERKTRGELRLYVYRTRFDNDTVTMRFVINKADEIEGVELLPE
ncbi:beta-lactamase family protein [Massilia sp. IC2-477]|uniref:serine hydrolase domain-containing protein n=1 Tax=Massilia sp. IC2-477 TaxID=2887198 RepID=UPI001D125EB0|nr:serine hydrolase domain-containing protein [Massilia sp. IC2-477]MCC2957207.1 beta-lactamase family protein [Massilia sp. IC2-477]